MARLLYTSLANPGHIEIAHLRTKICIILCLLPFSASVMYKLRQKRNVLRSEETYSEMETISKELGQMTAEQEIVASHEKIKFLVHKYEEYGLKVQRFTYDVLLYFPNRTHNDMLTITDNDESCYPLKIELCQGFGYEETTVDVQTQETVSVQLGALRPLIQFNCDRMLLPLLCAMQAPQCNSFYPCKPMCLAVKKACLAVFVERFGIAWPEVLDCNRLPDYDCLDAEELPGAQESAKFTAFRPTPTTTTAGSIDCQESTSATCKQYNSLTQIPNHLNHESQDDANLELHQFLPLINVGCSDSLAPFLCSVYSPACGAPLPCRPLCQSAKDGCGNLMNKFGFQWPEKLQCDQFRETGCFEGRKQTTPTIPTQEHTNVTVVANQTAYLWCTISNDRQNTVSWKRDGDDTILTVGENVFANDHRMQVVVDKKNNHQDYLLIIRNVHKNDSGYYNCLISKPPQYFTFELTVIDTCTTKNMCVDTKGHALRTKRDSGLGEFEKVVGTISGEKDKWLLFPSSSVLTLTEHIANKFRSPTLSIKDIV